MDFKEIQQKLKALRDQIKQDGGVSADAEEQLKTILSDTLLTANDELASIQNKLNATLAMRAGNDNDLTPEQKKRLRILEKTGTGSCAVH